MLDEDLNTANTGDDFDPPEFNLSFNLTHFFDQLNKINRNNDHIYLQEETSELYYKIFSNFKDFKQKDSFDLNLSRHQLINLKNFIKRKPFKICDTDKNVGLAILSNDLYDDLVNQELNNSNVYELIENSDSLQYFKESLVSSLNCRLIDLWHIGKITKSLKNHLFIEKETFGSFRLLMKLHKDKFTTRPIINNRNHFTWKISLLIDKVLRPFVEKMFSYIKDSQHLMLNASNKRFDPKKVKIVSADFKNMYQAIDKDDLANRLTDFLNEEKFECKDGFKLEGFRNLILMLFDFNFFIYKNKIYKQKNGITMGTKAGPSLANLYVFTFEKDLIKYYNMCIHFYQRFIDDLFLILNLDFDLSILNNSFGNLELTFQESNVVNYLDLNISICNLTNKLSFSLYTKQTNTFSYLLTSSNHKKSIFKNIIKSLLIRNRRICSKFSDFLFFSFKLKNHLLKRDYDTKMFNSIFSMVCNLKREDILPYKKRKCLNFENNIFLKLAFDKNCNNFNSFIKNSFNSSLKLKPEFENTNLKILNFNQPSLSSLLLHFKGNLNLLFQHRYKFCKKLDCFTCNFASNKHYINLKNFKLPILTESTCTTKNCIYVIECTLCKAFYIGETGMEFKVRFYQHLNSIKNFIPYKKATQVSTHFNLNNHDYKKHLNFFIYDTVDSSPMDEKLDETTLSEIYILRRYNLENILFNFIKSFNVETLNYFEPNYSFIKYDKHIYSNYI
jgi:hypothetical protein